MRRRVEKTGEETRREEKMRGVKSREEKRTAQKINETIEERM